MRRPDRYAAAGALVIGLASLLASPLARAQAPRESTEARSSEVPAPRVEGDANEGSHGVEVTASFTDGVRLRVPEAADFTAAVHVVAWARFVVERAPRSDADAYFEVPVVRPVLQVGVLDDKIRVFVQPELAGPSPRLLDLHVDLAPDPALQVRIGQFIAPYSRIFITPLPRLTMTDFGVVSDTFRVGRDTGLMVFGQAGTVFEYAAGIFNGSGIDGRLGDTPAPMGVARVVVTPFGSVPYDQAPSLGPTEPSGLAIGLGGFYRERDLATAGNPPAIQDTASAGADLSFVQGPLTLFAEGFFREDRVADGAWVGSWGAFAQAGVFVVPRVLQLSARAGWIDPSIETEGDFVQSYEGAVKWYCYFDDVAYGHHLSLGVQYRFMDAQRAVAPLPAGRAHRVTAQLQVWI